MKKILTWFASPHGVTTEPPYKAREIWMYGHVDPKTWRVAERPVLVFRKATDGMFWGLPLTNIGSDRKPLYVPRLKNGKKVSAFSQMRTLKAERLVKRLGEADEKEFGVLATTVVRRLVETMGAPKPARAERAYHAPKRARSQYQSVRSPFSPVYTLQPRA